MSILLQLGAFLFQGLEVPQRILLTTKQRLVIHHLGSGTSAIDSLGTDTEAIRFRGIFSGEGARRRIQSIEYMRAQGAAVPLSWAAMTLSVVIRRFDLSYSTSQWVQYALTCYVVPMISLEDADPLVDLLGSPNIQINDILALLEGTDFSPTVGQMSMLSLLSARKYDTVPSAALQQVEPMVASIENQLHANEFEQVAGMRLAPLSDPHPVRLLNVAAASAGLEASLVLAHGRLKTIMVNAIAGGR